MSVLFPPSPVALFDEPNPLIVWEDRFDDAHAAGSVDATVVPGAFVGGVAVVRSVVDTGTDLSIAGGQCVIAGGTGNYGDPGIEYELVTPAAIPVSALHGVLAKLAVTDTNQNLSFGFDGTKGGNVDKPYLWWNASADILVNSDAYTQMVVENFSGSSTQELLILQRSATYGYLFFVKSGGLWKLAAVNTDAIVDAGGATAYMGVANRGAALTINRVAHVDLSSRYGGDFAERLVDEATPAHNTLYSLPSELNGGFVIAVDIVRPDPITSDNEVRGYDDSSTLGFKFGSCSGNSSLQLYDYGASSWLADVVGALPAGVTTAVKLVVDSAGAIKLYAAGVLEASGTLSASARQVKSVRPLHSGAGESQADLSVTPYPALGLCTSRVVCPQTGDTATHTADYKLIVRNVTVPSANFDYIQSDRLDDSNCHQLQIKSDGEVKIKKYIGGAPSTLVATAAAALSDGDDLELAVWTSAGTRYVALFINGTQQGSDTATTVPARTTMKIEDFGDGMVADAIELWQMFRTWNLD